MNFDQAATWAAGHLADLRSEIAGMHPHFNENQLLQATLASWNFGNPARNISGNPATIDDKTTGNNYGSNTMSLMDCFDE
jgi:hypothetical protein